MVAPGVRARLLKRAETFMLPMVSKSFYYGYESVDSRDLHNSLEVTLSSSNTILFSSLIKIDCLGAASSIL
jgi:hypothetical protein